MSYKYGQFEIIIEEPIAYYDAGYKFRDEDPRIVDEDLYRHVEINVGSGYAAGLLDDLYDMPLIAKGEDGEIYALTVWNAKPFCWQRLYKVG